MLTGVLLFHFNQIGFWLGHKRIPKITFVTLGIDLFVD